MTNDFDPKDPKITAYTLNELNSSEKEEVEKLIIESDAAQRAVRDIRKTVGLLTEEFRKEAKPALTEAHRQMIERSLDSKNTVKPISQNRRTNRSRRRFPVWATACLLLVAASVWAYRTGLFESRQGSDTNRVAKIEKSDSVGNRTLPDERLERETSPVESPALNASKLDRFSNKDGELSADDRPQERTLNLIPSSQPNSKSKNSNRGLTVPSAKRGLGGGGTGGSSNYSKKSGRLLKTDPLQQLQKEKIQSQEKQKPSGNLSILRSENNRLERRTKRRFRNAYMEELYLGTKMSKDSKPRNRSFGRQRKRILYDGKSTSVTRSGERGSEKGFRGKQKKPIDPKNEKLADKKAAEFFKKQPELGKKLKSPGIELEGKGKEIDDSNRDKDAILSHDEGNEFRDEIVVENEFLPAMRYPNSSFPLDVANISLAEIVQHIEKGTLPPPSSVRIEEMLNHFEYSDTPSKNGGLFDVAMESGPCPWNRDHTLVRIGIKGKQIKSLVKAKTNPQTIARDVKLKVQFNPAVVGWYRLIGYEYDSLALEEFEETDDLVAGCSVTALFEIVPTSFLVKRGEILNNKLLRNKYVAAPKLTDRRKHRNELLSIELSYKPAGENRMRSLTVPHVPNKGSSVSKDFNWASAVAMYGLLLRNSYHAGDANLELVRKLATVSQGKDRLGRRKKFIDLVEKTIEMVKQQPGK